MTWTIHYSDGSSFNSSDGRPQDAPKVDVQIIQQGEDLLFYHDYYLWRTDLQAWVPCNGIDGLLDHLMAFADRIDAVVNGRYMARVEWEALLHKVKKNMVKHGYSAQEIRQLSQRDIV